MRKASVCEYCGVELTIDNFINHYSECKPKVPKMYRCAADKCTESFDTDEELSRHSRQFHWNTNAVEKITLTLTNEEEESLNLENSEEGNSQENTSEGGFLDIENQLNVQVEEILQGKTDDEASKGKIKMPRN